MYRDGCGGPTMEPKIIEKEIPFVINAVQGYAQGYNPKVLYVLTNKRISHRLFEPGQYQGEYVNPGPGTVLDTALVESEGP